jgi:hypothetical protein
LNRRDDAVKIIVGDPPGARSFQTGGGLTGANTLLKAALPGVIAGCAVYLAGAFLGPSLRPGGQGILQGGASSIGLIGVVIGVRRQRRARSGQ